MKTRDLAKQKYMFELVEEWKKGELTQKQVCANSNISQSLFKYWHNKYIIEIVLL